MSKFWLFLKNHWRLVAIVASILVVLVGSAIALAMTLPIKSVEIEGEVLLLQGEAYVSGFNVKATTKAGIVHREEVLPSMLTDFDPNVTGEQEVTVRYKKHKAKAVINVIAPSEITLCVREGTLPVEYEPNDPFPKSGVFDLYYNGEVFRSAPISRSGAPDFTTLLSGNYEIFLTYRAGLSIPYSYCVLEIVELIEPVGKLYAEQGVSLSKQTAIGNIRFHVKYKDGTEADIPIYDESIGIKEGALEVRDVEYDTEVVLTYKGYEIHCPTFAYKGNLMSVRSMDLHLDRTVYVQGEAFDYSTAYIEVEFLRFVGDVMLLRVTQEMLPAVTFTESGNVLLTATYFGAEAHAAVRVITMEEASTVTAIDTTWRGRKDGPPLKGQDLEYEDQTINVTYGYGYREETVALTADMVSGYDKMLAGDQELTISYAGYNCPIVFRVGDPDSTEATDIFAVMGWSEPTYYSSDALIVPDTAYLDVEIGYGASHANVPLSDPAVTITGFVPHVLDEQILIISYQSLAVQIGFYVRDDRVEEIVSFWAPASITIDVGEDLDLSGSCTVFYSTGRQETVSLSEVMEMGGRMEGMYDPALPGVYSLTFYYPDFDITDHPTWIYVEGEAPVTITGVRVDVSSAKTAYSIGDSLDLAGMKLYMTYSDGSERDVSDGLFPSNISGFSTAEAGVYSATVTYFYNEGSHNYITSFEYTVS